MSTARRMASFGKGVPAILITGTTAFGTITQGTPSDAVWTILNIGSAILTIGARNYPSGFSEQSAPGSLSLAPGASTTFTVRATAASIGSFSGNISVASNALTTPTLRAVSVTVQSTLNVNLLAYYRMEEASGNRVSQVNGYTLTDNNTVASTTGRQGLGAQFVAANSEYLSLADTADFRGLDRDWSFSLWVNPNATATTQYLFSKGTSTAAGTLDYFLDLNAATPQFRASNGSTNVTVSGSSIAGLAGTWIHLYVYHDSVNNLLGISVNNGTPTTSAFSASNSHLPGGNFYVGCSPILNNFFDGVMDEIGHWDRLLTTTERDNLYNSGAGMTYPFAA